MHCASFQPLSIACLQDLKTELERIGKADVLALPVSYGIHTSLVLVRNPGAEDVMDSCITCMDSVGGGKELLNISERFAVRHQCLACSI